MWRAIRRVLSDVDELAQTVYTEFSPVEGRTKSKRITGIAALVTKNPENERGNDEVPIRATALWHVQFFHTSQI